MISKILGLDGVVRVGVETTPPPLGALLRQFALRLFRKLLSCLAEHFDHRLLPFANGDMREPPKPKKPPLQD